jgi:hypothetical protein
MRRGARIFLVVLLAVWAGIVIGVSLISTPVKFQAPMLTMAAGLDVGRYTFRLLSEIELGLAAVAIAAAVLARPQRLVASALAVVIAAVVVQHYWLLPVLDARVTRILAGEPVRPSSYHTVFAAIEVIKSLLLVGAPALEIRRLSLQTPRGYTD